VLDRLRTLYRRIRIWRWRRKLLQVYAREARIRYGLGPGISPTMYAYDRALDEGLGVIVEEDGNWEFRWIWPDQSVDLEGKVVLEMDATDGDSA
jgi:hypothetical protein